MADKCLIFSLFFCVFSVFAGPAHSAVKEEQWLRVTIENRSERLKSISLRVKTQGMWNDWGREDSNWVRYRLNPQETVEIICRKCDYFHKRFEIAIFRPAKKSWFHHILTPNKVYWIELDSQKGWTLYHHGADFIQYFN